MTQLYVGNLSEEGDEKSIRNLFGKYGTVREVLMKNGYAFVEMESPLQAEHVMRVLNGTDILGHPMIVEPSHQQRLSSRRSQQGVVEVTNIPTHMTLEAIENYFNQTIGQVVKLEIEDNQPSDFGAKRVLISFESMEMAQRAAAFYSNEENILKCTVIGDYYRPGSGGGVKNGRRSIPSSPSKGNNEFPLRILVPSEMVGAIIGKDGATIRHITQLTKARVDVHRRENLGSMEKAITIIGGPESCTEACYQIMRIMQNELLTTNGSIFENGKHHFEPLPVVPLKVLAHNELVGRVIGKGGNTLKRIMAESGTKITISKLKDLTAYNMERTITILGTIDNCKKAESLISAKLRASYESDMSQFMLSIDHSPTSSPPHSGNPPPIDSFNKSSVIHPQSLPTTPTAVRTFQDFSQEHTRLTTLHGSTGALEVNGLGGFYSHINKPYLGGGQYAPPIEPGNQYSAMELPGSQYEPPMVNGTANGYGKPYQYNDPGRPPHSAGYNDDDDLTDVFHGLSLKDPPGIGGYGRIPPLHSRRSSAPTHSGGMMMGWHDSITEEDPSNLQLPSSNQPHLQSSKLMGMWNNTTSVSTAASSVLHTQSSSQGTGGSIWSPTFGSRPESELSSYHDSDSSNNGFSPIYSPVTAVTTGLFDPSTLISAGSRSSNTSTTVSADTANISNTTMLARSVLPSTGNPSLTLDNKSSFDSVANKQSLNYSYQSTEDDDSFLDKLIKDPATAVSSTGW